MEKKRKKEKEEMRKNGEKEEEKKEKKKQDIENSCKKEGVFGIFYSSILVTAAGILFYVLYQQLL